KREIENMKFKLHQMKLDYAKEYGFLPLTIRRKRLGTEEIDLNLYEVTYEGIVDMDKDMEEVLEGIFHNFNVTRPVDFKGYSMSVCDIVEINNRFYYTDSFGFEDVTEN